MFALLYYIDSVYQPTTECELNRVFARSFARSHISYSSMTKQLYWLLTSIYINEQKLCSIFLPVGVKSFVRSHSFLCYIYRPSTTNRMPFILCSMKSFFLSRLWCWIAHITIYVCIIIQSMKGVSTS